MSAADDDDDDDDASLTVGPVPCCVLGCSGIISPRAVLFRRELPQCPEDFGAVAAGAAASEDSSTGFELIIIIVLAVVALVLTVLLSVVVFKERQGAPIFTKL